VTILGFRYVNKNINGKKMRVLEDTKESFIKFIDAEINNLPEAWP
jgi:hypothetical protein